MTRSELVEFVNTLLQDLPLLWVELKKRNLFGGTPPEVIPLFAADYLDAIARHVEANPEVVANLLRRIAKACRGLK